MALAKGVSRRGLQQAQPGGRNNGPQQRVITLPTQTMHYSREISQIYHRFKLLHPPKMDGCHQQNCILCRKVLSGCIPIAGHLIHQDMYALLESFCGALMWNLFLCTLTKPDLYISQCNPMQRISAAKKRVCLLPLKFQPEIWWSCKWRAPKQHLSVVSIEQLMSAMMCSTPLCC